MRVLILAAGLGSRMKSKKNKCSIELIPGKDSSISRLINQIESIKPDSEFFVVLGYDFLSVITSISANVNYSTTKRINYIYNPSFNQYGCNYSISSAYPIFDGEDDVVILEADNVFSTKTLEEIINNESLFSRCLVRDKEFSSTKSVFVFSSILNVVNDIFYDTEHKTIPEDCTGSTCYESMQVFVISKASSSFFGKSLKFYKENVGSSFSGKESGVFSITDFFAKHGYLEVVNSSNPLGWVNINKQSDLKDAVKLIEEDEKK